MNLNKIKCYLKRHKWSYKETERIRKCIHCGREEYLQDNKWFKVNPIRFTYKIKI